MFAEIEQHECEVVIDSFGGAVGRRPGHDDSSAHRADLPSFVPQRCGNRSVVRPLVTVIMSQPCFYFASDTC